MRRHAAVLGLTFLGLAGFAILAGWAFFAASQQVDGGRSLGPLWPYLLGGVAILAALVGLLVWLGFYSVRHGHEERDGPS